VSIEPGPHHSGTLSPEFVLLGLLMAGPSHGYDLHQRVLSDLGDVWHLSQSQAYSILKRLEGRGEVSARRAAGSKPARQVLRITARGRKRFLHWLQAECATNLRSIRLEFLTRLYFAEHYMPEAVRGIYAAQRASVRDSIRRLEDRLAYLPQEQVYNRLSLELRCRHLRDVEQWMAEAAARSHAPKRSRE
jgi:DNA-binding PadR family transcriptional regulator